jgi:acetate---CoA ligase (ADP-forming)
LPSLPVKLVKRVRTLFSADVIALTNPIDLGVIFDFDLYAQVVEECLQVLSPDAILLINTYTLNEAEGAHRLARRVEKIVRESERPIAFCVYSQGNEGQTIQQHTSLPVFAEIEDALRGLAASRDWTQWRTRPTDTTGHSLHAPPKEAQQLLARSGVLTAEQALALCQAYGIPIAPFEVAIDPEDAARAADRVGYPVALKAIATDLVHKSDAGGVTLSLADAAAVRRESAEMLARIKHHAGLMVQRMVTGGLEVIIGGKRDRSFGPVVMFGLGGTHVEVFGDVTFRVAPLDRVDAKEMIEELRGKRLLDGVRGRLPMDRETLIKALLSVSSMLIENPRINEVDINPLVILEGGATAVDARAVMT